MDRVQAYECLLRWELIAIDLPSRSLVDHFPIDSTRHWNPNSWHISLRCYWCVFEWWLEWAEAKSSKSIINVGVQVENWFDQNECHVLLFISIIYQRAETIFLLSFPMTATEQSVSKNIFSLIKSSIVNVIYLRANCGGLIASIATDQTSEHLFRSRIALSRNVNSPVTSNSSIDIVTLIIQAYA